MVSFTEALHYEWKRRGVRVTALCPGPVPTEFQAVAGIADGEQQTLMTTYADQVAEQGYRGLMAGRRLVVPGAFNKLVVYRDRPVRSACPAASAGRRERQRGGEGR